MYKEGINLNTVTVEKLKTLPGIGDSLARSIILHRELKSEFVNPDEFKQIVPENVYSDIAKNYGIYAVSPFVWKNRIVIEEIKLKNRDLRIIFTGPSSDAVFFGGKLHVLGLPEKGLLDERVYSALGEGGLLLSLKKIFGWKAGVKILVLYDTPDMDTLESFLGRYTTGEIFVPDVALIASSGSSLASVSSMLLADRIKAFSASLKVASGDFEIAPVYPLKNATGLSSAVLVRYGVVAFLFMHEMSESAQKEMLDSPASAKLRDVRIIRAYGCQPSALVTNFCSSSIVVKPGSAKEVVCDGNVAYVRKK